MACLVRGVVTVDSRPLSDSIDPCPAAGATAGAAATSCSDAGRACDAFHSQFYRPALCTTCYLDIEQHFPGEWKKVVEEGKIYFVSKSTAQKLFARPADASDAVRGRAAVGKARSSDTGAPSAGGRVSEQVAAWQSFVPAGQAETAAADKKARAALLAVAGHPSPAGIHTPGLGVVSSAAPAGLATPSAVPTSGAGAVPLPPRAASVFGPGPAGTPAAPASQAAVAAAAGAGGSAAPATPRPAGAQATPDDLPEVPSAVPSAAFANLAIDLSRLTRAFAPMLSPGRPREGDGEGGTALPGSSSSAAASASAALHGSVVSALDASAAPALSADEASREAAAGPGSPPEEGPSAAGEAMADPVPAETTEAAGVEDPAVTHRPSVLTDDGSGGSVGESSAAAVAGALPSASPTASDALMAASGCGLDLSLHLSPLYGSPLLVDVGEMVRRGAAAGVAVFAVRQPFEEDYAVPRHLIITPFTVLAVAPHPTRLGIGLLKWERSILSLRRLTAQPLFAKAPAGARLRSADGSDGAVEVGPSARGRSDSAGSGGPHGAVGHGRAASGSGGVLGFLKKAAAGVAHKLAQGAQAVNSAVKGGDASNLPVPEEERLAPLPPAAVLGDPEALERCLAHPDAVGLLGSFAPETTDTVALLRMYRAGARPIRKEGYLHKRKRASWRERAPLGSLAWKRRYFVLQPTHITYYGASPEAGGSAKGVIPLTGWVEVAKVGAESTAVHRSLAHDATTRAHCFIVRTGRTHHVFQAASEADCEAWMHAISVNAQHVGMAVDEQDCIIMRDAADMQRLAEALLARRRDLVAAMAPAARAAAEASLEVDLHVAWAGDEGAGGSDAPRARKGPSGLVGAVSEDAGEDEEEPAAGTGLSLTDAAAIVEASGGVSEEILSQCSPAVQERLLRLFRLGDSRGGPAAGYDDGVEEEEEEGEDDEESPSFTQVVLPSGEIAYVASHAPVNATAGPDAEVGVLAPDGQTIVVAGASAAAAAGSSPSAQEGSWMYLDDSDRPQGPFSDSIMRSWLWAGYLRPDVCVRFALPLPGALDAAEGVNDAYVPQVYIPLSALFADPEVAFVSGDFSWLDTYKVTARYQHLFTTAVHMGLDRSAALQQVYLMKENGLPADLSILLDMVGVTDLAALRQQRLLDARTLEAPHPAAPHEPLVVPSE